MSPEEHDETLLRLEAELRTAQRAVDASTRAVRVSAGQRRRGGKWQTTEGLPASFKDALKEASHDRQVQFGEKIYDRDLVLVQIEDHEKAYGGWSRFRLVISSDGHVHGDAKCRSFRPTTETVVIPALSGKTAEDAVAMLGNACCSVCMPRGTGAQTKISASLVGILVRRGSEAFNEALQRRKKVLDIR